MLICLLFFTVFNLKRYIFRAPPCAHVWTGSIFSHGDRQAFTSIWQDRPLTKMLYEKCGTYQKIGALSNSEDYHRWSYSHIWTDQGMNTEEREIRPKCVPSILESGYDSKLVITSPFFRGNLIFLPRINALSLSLRWPFVPIPERGPKDIREAGSDGHGKADSTAHSWH